MKNTNNLSQLSIEELISLVIDLKKTIETLKKENELLKAEIARLKKSRPGLR